MTDFARLLADGPATALLYLPVAFMIGALHALEPGHSKSLMAGFVIATRSSPSAAVLLGLSAAVAHSAVVWLLVAIGLALRDEFILGRVMPWLTLAGGLLTIGIATWMWRQTGAHHHHHHHHHHDHHHHHAHDHDHDGHHHHHDHHHHGHHHHFPQHPAMPDGPVSWPRVVAFGMTGGLVPCPAAVAVLFLCLQSGAALVGVATVAAFSLGLAVVLVGVGVAAALALGRMSQSGRLVGFAEAAQRVSPLVTGAAGVYLTVSGIRALG